MDQGSIKDKIKSDKIKVKLNQSPNGSQLFDYQNFLKIMLLNYNAMRAHERLKRWFKGLRF